MNNMDIRLWDTEEKDWVRGKFFISADDRDLDTLAFLWLLNNRIDVQDIEEGTIKMLRFTGFKDCKDVKAYEGDTVMVDLGGCTFEDPVDTDDDGFAEGVIIWSKSNGRWALDVGGDIVWPNGVDWFTFTIIHQGSKE